MILVYARLCGSWQELPTCSRRGAQFLSQTFRLPLSRFFWPHTERFCLDRSSPYTCSLFGSRLSDNALHCAAHLSWAFCRRVWTLGIAACLGTENPEYLSCPLISYRLLIWHLLSSCGQPFKFTKFGVSQVHSKIGLKIHPGAWMSNGLHSFNFCDVIVITF